MARRKRRKRTTVSLFDYVWDAAAEEGGSRGRGLEKFADFWIEKTKGKKKLTEMKAKIFETEEEKSDRT